VVSSSSVIDLSGRVAIVTGGNRGIGLGLARGIARAGGSVAVWGRRPERNDEAVRELEALDAKAAGFVCDVSNEKGVAQAMAATLETFGRLDTLVANAGVSAQTPFVDMRLADWRSLMAINLEGAFLSLREAARVLVEQAEGGALVGVSSASSLHGAPGQEHYAASKTAVLAVMRSLAVELARHGIRANSLVPGWTETEMTAPARRHERFLENTTKRTPVRRWATLHDFEAVGAFLADPGISFHTGDSIVVDGGYTVF
jgi:NAD(P)-dependent dehydrogenase (short-subunit alcohol dehydrogenase family)